MATIGCIGRGEHGVIPFFFGIEALIVALIMIFFDKVTYSEIAMMLALYGLVCITVQK